MWDKDLENLTKSKVNSRKYISNYKRSNVEWDKGYCFTSPTTNCSTLLFYILSERIDGVGIYEVNIDADEAHKVTVLGNVDGEH